MKRITKAVLPAAGLGTRFLPATKAVPKEMLPIVDKPALQYIVEEIIASGITDLIIITARGKGAIEDHFDYAPELERELCQKGNDALAAQIHAIGEGINLHYIRQKQPLGLGHAVACARPLIGDEPFAVLLGDDIAVCKTPALRQLMDAYEHTGTSIIGVNEVPRDDVSRYGVVDPDPAVPVLGGLMKLRGLVEKPPLEQAPSNLAVFGRYVITPKIFDKLAIARPGAGGEIQLTDALRALGEEEALYALNFEGERYDVGNKLGYLRATVDFALRDATLGPAFAQMLAQKQRNGEF